MIEKISSSKKLVVGHNMLLDLGHTVNQFISPLPETLPEFKVSSFTVSTCAKGTGFQMADFLQDLMSTHLPNICDTKLMASTSPFKEEIPRSTLEEMIKTVSEKPFRLPKVWSLTHFCVFYLLS